MSLTGTDGAYLDYNRSIKPVYVDNADGTSTPKITMSVNERKVTLNACKPGGTFANNMDVGFTITAQVDKYYVKPDLSYTQTGTNADTSQTAAVNYTPSGTFSGVTDYTPYIIDPQSLGLTDVSTFLASYITYLADVQDVFTGGYTQTWSSDVYTQNDRYIGYAKTTPYLNYHSITYVTITCESGIITVDYYGQMYNDSFLPRCSSFPFFYSSKSAKFISGNPSSDYSQAVVPSCYSSLNSSQYDTTYFKYDGNDTIYFSDYAYFDLTLGGNPNGSYYSSYNSNQLGSKFGSPPPKDLADCSFQGETGVAIYNGQSLNCYYPSGNSSLATSFKIKIK